MCGGISQVLSVFSAMSTLSQQRSCSTTVCTDHSFLSPSLPFPEPNEHMYEHNSSLLKPRRLTQAFFGPVQLTARTCGQQVAAGPTGTPMCLCP